MSTSEKAEKHRSIWDHLTCRPRPNAGLSYNLVRILLPGISRRRTRQLHEWTWVTWFLLVGWWAVPIILATWVLWTIVKYTVYFIVGVVDMIKAERRRSGGGDC